MKVEVRVDRRYETFDFPRVGLADEVARRAEGRTVAAVSHAFIPGQPDFVSVLLITERLLDE